VQREIGKEWVTDFYEKLQVSGLINGLEKCMACGKCVGTCPVAALTGTYNSRRIVRDVLCGNTERLLASEEIWQCIWCKTCQVMCPHDIDIPMLILTLRFEAMKSGYGYQYAAIFKRFAESLYQHGLSFVPGDKRMEQIQKNRTKLGLTPLVIDEKAIRELQIIFDETGATRFISQLEAQEEKPLRLTYMKG